MARPAYSYRNMSRFSHTQEYQMENKMGTATGHYLEVMYKMRPIHTEIFV